LAIVSWSKGDTGNTVEGPTGRPRATTPYIIRLDPQWNDVSGYRPIRVTVQRRAATGILDERTVEVAISPWMWGSYDSQLTVVQEVTIPEGEVRGSATVYIPQNRSIRGCSVSVTAGGRRIRELDGLQFPFPFTTNYNNNVYNDAIPSLLVLDYDAPTFAMRDQVIAELRAIDNGTQTNRRYLLPNLSAMVSLIPNSVISGSAFAGGHDLSTLEDVKNCPRVQLIPPEDLVGNWLSLSGIDVAIISMADLVRLYEDDAGKWQLLDDWLLAGGNLIVYDVGENFAQLAQLESLLGLPSQIESDVAADGGSEEGEPETASEESFVSYYRGWTPARVEDYSDRVDVFNRMQNGQVVYYGPSQGYITTSSDGDDEQQVVSNQVLDARNKLAKELSPFVKRKNGMGMVVAVAGNPFPGTREQWTWLFNSIDEERWLWSMRHGVSLRRDNQGYWRFLIPNVGLAPINAFRILISMFVVVIGPVNFYLLRRAKRLPLLMVTVPAGAAIVIGSLFFYALATDGLRMQYRIRSLSHVDQTRDHVVCWARHAYYSGLTPSSGFSFPRDIAVYPIDQQGQGDYGRNSVNRQIAWTDQSQNLRAGYVAPRVTSQFLTVRSRPSQRGLQIDAASKGTAPTAINRLGTNLKSLYLCDEHGDLYLAREVANGESAKLSSTDSKTCKEEMEKLFQSAPLVTPASFDQQDYLNAMQMNQRYYYSSTDEAMPMVQESTSILEKQLNDLRRNWTYKPVPRTYMAIVEVDPEVELGVRSGQARLPLSIITGQW
jgi:hypothetical protein